MKASNSCIRVFADEHQIGECKEDIQRISRQTDYLSRILGLAGNEVRLKILFLIYKEGEMCPCDLSDVLGMSVPAISQHLRKMKDGSIIRDKKVGQTIFYSIVDEHTGLIKPVLDELMKQNKKVLIKDEK